MNLVKEPSMLSVSDDNNPYVQSCNLIRLQCIIFIIAKLPICKHTDHDTLSNVYKGCVNFPAYGLKAK